MADVESLEKDGLTFAQRAIKCDSEGLVDTAVFYYVVSKNLLYKMVVFFSQFSYCLKPFQDKYRSIKLK